MLLDTKAVSLSLVEAAGLGFDRTTARVMAIGINDLPQQSDRTSQKNIILGKMRKAQLLEDAR
jgi:hypothetical protein